MEVAGPPAGSDGAPSNENAQQAQASSAPAVQCWACGVLVAVPIINGELAPVFRCGWCGAISEAAPPGAGAGASRRRRGLWRGFMRLLSRLSYIVVLFVLGLVFVIIAPGVGFVLPALSSNPVIWLVHTAITWFVSAGVLFNYLAAVFTSPGTVLECCEGLPPAYLPRPKEGDNGYGRGGGGVEAAPVPSLVASAQAVCAEAGTEAAEPGAQAGPGLGLQPATGHAAGGPQGLVRQGAYSHLTYCWSCRGPKPRDAHHCHMCSVCVVDLDHHCPFVANCVGRGNMRNFISFLAFTCAAMAYCLAVCGFLLARDRAAASAGFGAASAAYHRSLEASAKRRPGMAPPGRLAAAAAAALAWVEYVTLLIGLTELQYVAALWILLLSLGVLAALSVLLTQAVRHCMRHGWGGAGALPHVRLQHHVHPASDAAVMQAELESERRRQGWRNLARTMAGPEVVDGRGGEGGGGGGCGGWSNAWRWVWPMWGPPPGVLLRPGAGRARKPRGASKQKLP
ncbi:hypothetical protein HYH03_016872 [Edaphochlamys debaryana]|uniref:S-acyltransferase n=1 Tax=Edaphochlamys debaryana TaxID=47281 RepID=A0A836BPQ1_9CHLO|nr:hypothetical protein HYH03_016872 [Edaphochlamys debaryana]|eukprot:KAG2484330.1 hypothetical protein HYH03_016872 [Edaphochlamys debaryana]